MSDCCGPDGYDRTFSTRFARQHGAPVPPARAQPLRRCPDRLPDRTRPRGRVGARDRRRGGACPGRAAASRRSTCGQPGDIHQLRGRGRAAAGPVRLRGPHERRVLDVARAPEEVEPADVVVLHRVVCCYPDYERLLAAAGSKAGRLLVFSHPPRNLATRAVHWAENTVRRWKGDDFRAFAHPPERMLAVLARGRVAPDVPVARVRLVRGRARTLTGSPGKRARSRQADRSAGSSSASTVTAMTPPPWIQ